MLEQKSLFDLPPRDFSRSKIFGPDVTVEDHKRLVGQLKLTFDLMRDGCWRTLAAGARLVGCSEASFSARLRDLRRKENGGHTVLRRKVKGTALFEYRLIEVK